MRAVSVFTNFILYIQLKLHFSFLGMIRLGKCGLMFNYYGKHNKQAGILLILLINMQHAICYF